MSSGLAAWLAVAASDGAFVPVVVLGALGALGIVVATVRSAALGPALAASASAYAVLLVVDDPPLDGRAVGVAASLVLVGELVGWSRELTSPTTDEAGNAWRRPVWIAGAGSGALLVAAILLAVVDLARLDGLVVEVFGALAALSLLILVVMTARDELS